MLRLHRFHRAALARARVVTSAAAWLGKLGELERCGCGAVRGQLDPWGLEVLRGTCGPNLIMHRKLGIDHVDSRRWKGGGSLEDL